MTEIRMTQTGGCSKYGIPEANVGSCFEHSDIRILSLFRISDFVLRIYCPRAPLSCSVI